MKGLFETKPCSPTKLVRHTRKLLVYLDDANPASCENRRETKVDDCRIERKKVVCSKRLSTEEVTWFWSAVAKDYHFQMYYDDQVPHTSAPFGDPSVLRNQLLHHRAALDRVPYDDPDAGAQE